MYGQLGMFQILHVLSYLLKGKEMGGILNIGMALGCAIPVEYMQTIYHVVLER